MDTVLELGYLLGDPEYPVVLCDVMKMGEIKSDDTLIICDRCRGGSFEGVQIRIIATGKEYFPTESIMPVAWTKQVCLSEECLIVLQQRYISARDNRWAMLSKYACPKCEGWGRKGKADCSHGTPFLHPLDCEHGYWFGHSVP